jgi:iron(III) transport system ATP-binding protein
MVFQSYAVWPHMTVFDNVAYPLAVRRLPRSEIRSRVDDVLALTGLEELGQRPAPQLSGGQQQRVALARALVARPDVLLLDEPLSNLDAQLRRQMREELKRLQSEVRVTTVYVTHDQEEALSMSDELMIMNRGQAVQYGTPMQVYHQPANHFAATFVGSANFLPCSSLDGPIRPGQNRLETPIGTLLANASDASVGGTTGDVCIRPEAIRLVPEDGTADGSPQDGPPDENHYAGVVLGTAFLGDRIDYEVRLGEIRLRARAASTVGLSADQAVSVQIPARYCTILPTNE